MAIFGEPQMVCRGTARNLSDAIGGYVHAKGRSNIGEGSEQPAIMKFRQFSVEPFEFDFVREY